MATTQLTRRAAGGEYRYSQEVGPPLSIAPMMRWTDRHFRYFMRRITRRTLLYTEMMVDHAVLKGHREELLGFSECEHPLALQVAGSDPERMARCAEVAEEWGYDEININVGCPSESVQEGAFGVCLMSRPRVVADCVSAMRDRADLPVTVKQRIGFDELDTYEEMANFVETVADAGCRRFTIHARKAWLDGVSPEENRNVPPLRYEDVYRLGEAFPELFVEINGGIDSLDDAASHLERADAVMIGRAATERPYIFAEADAEFFGDDWTAPPRRDIAEAMAEYAEWWLERGGKLNHVADRIINLYSHRRGAGAWRRHLGENVDRNDPEVILEAARRAETA